MVRPADLISGRRQDRRMKNNILIEGSYRGGKIASFQRDREDSLGHASGSWVVGQGEGRGKGTQIDAIDHIVKSPTRLRRFLTNRLVALLRLRQCGGSPLVVRNPNIPRISVEGPPLTPLRTYDVRCNRLSLNSWRVH